MALKNYALAVNGGSVSKTAMSGNGAWSETGTIENIRDLNTSTLHGVSLEASANATFTDRITFSKVVTLKEIYVKGSAGGGGMSGGGGGLTVKLYNSSNGLIATVVNLGSAGAVDQTFTGTWNAVKYIEFQGSCGSSGSGSGGATCSELTPYGIGYDDIGLRIKAGASILKIGVEALTASHKLRIHKNGTTYGIPLVATNDTDATGLRIYDGVSIKALPKVD